MDEFEKIKEVSDDIMGRKEPSFSEKITDLDEDDSYSFEPIDQNSDTDLQETHTRFRLHRIHIIGIVVLVLIFVVGTTAFMMTRDDGLPDKVITITATPDPVRVRPTEPGGINIPDQGKQIYDRVNANAVPTKVERLFPEPERPVLPEILIQQATPEPKFVAVQDIPAINPLADAPLPVVVEEVPPAPKKEVIPLPIKAEATPKKKAEEKQVTPAATPVSTGIWRVQLLSTTKKASVEKAWPTILKKHKALLSDMSHDIVSAEIPGKGTFYRLWVGRFTTRDQATALCKKLKAQKQECMPVKGSF